MHISFSSVKADVENLIAVFYNTFYSVLFQSLFLESRYTEFFLKHHNCNDTLSKTKTKKDKKNQ